MAVPIIAVAVLLAFLFAGGSSSPQTQTVTLGGPGHESVALAPPAQAVAKSQAAQSAAGQEQAAHSDLRAEPAAAKQAAPRNDALGRTLAQPTPPATIPLASVHERGCRTLSVRNYSTRTGSPSLLIVLHQTISPDDGWNGVLGNVRWFDSSAAQASSNYIVARTGGQCAYIVPEAYKAWAQAGFNSVTPCSIEVTETGKEGSYLVGAGERKVVQIVHDCAKRWHIPLQHGKVSGCTVTRPGVVEHIDLGSCGGGHFDDSPYSIDPVIAAARRLGSVPKTPIHYTAHEARTIHLVTSVRLRPSTPARRDAITRYRATLIHYRANLRTAARASGWDRQDRRRRYAGLLSVYKG